MDTRKQLTWVEWNDAIYTEMQRLLAAWGRSDDYDVGTLKRAEILGRRIVISRLLDKQEVQ